MGLRAIKISSWAEIAGCLGTLPVALLVSHFFVDINQANALESVSVILSIAATLLVTIIISSALKTAETDEKMSDLRGDIIKEIGSLTDRINVVVAPGDGSTSYLGHIAEVHKYLTQNAPQAIDIYNTRIVSPGSLKSQSDIDSENVVDLISHCVNEGVKWIEVLSEDGIPRMDAVRARCVDKKNYYPRIMKAKFPVSNFIVLKYGGALNARKSEVLFGFGYHETDDRVQVFLSTNDLIVEQYIRMHGNLERNYSEPA